MLTEFFSFTFWRKRPWLIGIFAVLLTGLIHIALWLWLENLPIPLSSLFLHPNKKNISISVAPRMQKVIPVLPPILPPNIIPTPQIPPVLIQPKPPNPPPHQPTRVPSRRPPVKTRPPTPPVRPVVPPATSVPPKNVTPGPPAQASSQAGPPSLPQGDVTTKVPGKINLFSKDALNKALGDSTQPHPGSPLPSSSHSSQFAEFDKRLAGTNQVQTNLRRLIPEKDGGSRYESENVIAHIKPDCTMTISNRFPIGFQKGGTFTFDVSDMIMKAKGQHPYAAEIRRIRQDTQAFRDQLCKKVREERLKHAQEVADVELIRIWQSSTSIAQKRKELFHYWVEAMDELHPQIISFIREHLPANSENAYTEQELIQMNEERKQENISTPFHPYPKKKIISTESSSENNSDKQPAPSSESPKDDISEINKQESPSP